jgi:hypothetical protein
MPSGLASAIVSETKRVPLPFKKGFAFQCGERSFRAIKIVPSRSKGVRPPVCGKALHFREVDPLMGYAQSSSQLEAQPQDIFR